MNIFENAHLTEQFRFPRTKKRRIRKKWANRPENRRPIVDRAYQFPNGDLVCHPIFAAQLRQHLSK